MTQLEMRLRACASPEKQRLAEEFVPRAAVEALAEAVRHGIPGLDVVPLEIRVSGPAGLAAPPRQLVRAWMRLRL